MAVFHVFGSVNLWKKDENKWCFQYEVLWWVNWRIFSFHSLGKSELSPLLASQIRVYFSIFLTHNEKAFYLSRQHILFTAYGGLPWHSTQTQFSHVQHRVPKANHWNSQATALLPFAATHNTPSTSQSSLWAIGSQNLSPGKENDKSHAGATFKSSAKLKQNQRKHILESITIKKAMVQIFPREFHIPSEGLKSQY